MQGKLLQVVLAGVVIKVELQRQVGAVELLRQRFERIGGGNAAPGSAVQRNVARGTHHRHPGHAAVGHDGKLYRNSAFLQQRWTRYLRNQVVPVDAYYVHDAAEVGTEIHALGIAQNLQVAGDAAVRAGAHAELAARAPAKAAAGGG